MAVNYCPEIQNCEVVRYAPPGGTSTQQTTANLMSLFASSTPLTRGTSCSTGLALNCVYFNASFCFKTL